jgi:PAS domain S-box-containing protein
MPRRTRTPVEKANNHEVEPSELVHQVRSLLAEAQALSVRLAALNEVAVSMQHQLDPEQVLQTLARQARWVIDFQICSVAWSIPGGYQFQVLRGPHPGLGETRLLSEGAVGKALREDHAVLVHQALQADDLPAGMVSALLVPLKSAGQPLGTLNFYSSKADRYTLDDMRIAAALTTQAAAILHNVRLFTEVTLARDELHTVLNSITDAVLVIDRYGAIRMLNGAAARLFRLDPTTAVGQRALRLAARTSVQGYPLISGAAVSQVMRIWKSAEHCGGGTFQLGDGRHLEWAIAPLIATGVLNGAVLTFRDISDRVALEQLRDDMIQMLVHDLRTPLTGVIMGIDMLSTAIDRNDPEVRDEMLRMSRLSAHQLLGQINLLLDLRKLEAGQMSLDIDLVSMPSLLERAVASVQPIAHYNEQTIDLCYTGDLPILSLDQGLIRRTFENLLGNAIKFSPEQSTIRMRAFPIPGGVEINVVDQGPGIPEAMRSTIFEKYAQIDGAGRKKGTGLGLAFCKLIVEIHGGSIGVNQAPDGGSCFWVRLPVG